MLRNQILTSVEQIHKKLKEEDGAGLYKRQMNMTNMLKEKHNIQLWVKKGSQSGIVIDPSEVDACLYLRERDEMVVSGIKKLPSADELNRVILPGIQQYSKINGKPFDIFEARSMHYLIKLFKDLGCRVIFSAPTSHIKGDAVVYSNNRAFFLEAKEKTPIVTAISS